MLLNFRLFRYCTPSPLHHFFFPCLSMHGLLILAFCILTVNHVACDIDVIVKQCREDWCYALSHNDTRFQGLAYYEKLFNFFAAGFPQLIYSDISNLTANSLLSEPCNRALIQVKQELDHGKEWAFQFVDSSAKTSSGFLEGSVTSFGDYDECVNIQEPDSNPNPNEHNLAGMYCLADIFPEGYIGKEKRKDGKVSLNQMQRFNNTGYYFGLCFPSHCSTSDVRTILTAVLKPYPLRVYGYLHCDTREQNTWRHRIMHMRRASIFALLFIISVIGLVFYGTFNHLFRPHANGILYFKSFSLIGNFYKLIVVRADSVEDSYTTMVSTGMKMVLMICGTAAHVYACIELPIGFFVMDRHSNMERMMMNSVLMPLFGDGGIVVSASLAGFLNFMFTYPLAKDNKLPVLGVLVDKCVRYIPVILCVMCLDMIWYMPFTGPLVSRVGDVVVEKCSKYWWRSILFISNLVGDSIDICSGHTYSLSVDVHLFLMGLVAVLLFAKRPAYGIAYSLLSSAIGICLSLYYATVYEVAPNLLVGRNPSIWELERFLLYIHMATSSYVPSYFSAMILAYWYSEGYLNKLAVQVNHPLWLGLIIALSNLGQFSPMLTNTLDVVSKPYVPYFIVGVRGLKSMEMFCLLTYAALLDLNEKMRNVQSSVSQTKGTRFSFWKMLTRLAFAIYMCNYLFIRADFFSARKPFHNNLYVYSQRLITSLLILIPWSIVYHLFFIAPFMSLVNEARRRPKNKEQ